MSYPVVPPAAQSVPALHSTLHRRLIEILALEPGDPFTATSAAESIRGYCETAVCCQMNGRCATFEAVFQAVFAQKLDGSPLKTRKGAA
jgi:hypothetical protein